MSAEETAWSEDRRQSLRGHAAMLLFSALVAGSFSLGVRAANLIDPAALTAARFALAAAVIGGVILATKPKPQGQPLTALWRYPLLGGVFAAYFVLMFEGLKTSSPVSAAAVFTLTPIMAGGFGWLLMRQRMTPRMAAALALGGAGALWVIFRGDLSALLRLDFGRGEAIYLLGCAFHALYTPLVRRLNRGESPTVFTFGTLVAGGLLLLVWGWPAIRATDWANLPGIVWITLVYIAVFASAATFVLVQYATLRLPAAKVMAYTYLTPLWVMLLESLSGTSSAGTILLPGILAIMTALFLLLRE